MSLRASPPKNKIIWTSAHRPSQAPNLERSSEQRFFEASDRADALGREQHDLGPLDMLQRRVAVGDHRLKSAVIYRAECDRDARAHDTDFARPESRTESPPGLTGQI